MKGTKGKGKKGKKGKGKEKGKGALSVPNGTSIYVRVALPTPQPSEPRLGELDIQNEASQEEECWSCENNARY